MGASPIPIPINETNLGGQVVTQVEAHFFTSLLLAEPAMPGDSDLDGSVDGADFLAWQRNSGVGELTDWRANFGTGASAAAQTAVPEPTGATLRLALAVMSLSRSRRIQERRQHILKTQETPQRSIHNCGFGPSPKCSRLDDPSRLSVLAKCSR
jgi:hypothetical protein